MPGLATLFASSGSDEAITLRMKRDPEPTATGSGAMAAPSSYGFQAASAAQPHGSRDSLHCRMGAETTSCQATALW